MTPDKGVFKRKGSDVWQHRVYIPKDLQGTYGGKSDLPAKSLGTRDLAEANRRARVRLADYERQFASKREALGGEQRQNVSAAARCVSAEVIERLAAARAYNVVEADFAHRASVFERAEADPVAFWRGDIVPAPADQMTFKGQPYSYWDYLAEDPETPLETGIAYVLHKQQEQRLASMRTAYAVGNVGILRAEAKALLSGYKHDASDELKLLRRLMEVEIATRAVIAEEQAANIPAPTSEVKDDGENPLLSNAVAAWLAEKKSLVLTGRRLEDCEAAVALFLEVIGDKPIASYTKGDVREFKSVLRALPANRTKIKETKGLDARAAAKEAERLGLGPISVKTANNKYLSTLYNLFEFAIGNYDRVDRNLFVNATFPSRSTPREEWDPFSVEALRTFFNAPLYTGCKSAKQWMEAGVIIPRDSARFWIPLLLLYTGARVNEICKLRVVDVGEEEGIPYLAIAWEEDDEGRGIAGRVKNVSSERRVPIHQDLISYGFLDFVARARARADERLFSELKPNRHGKLYSTISQRFSDTFLPRLGIKTDKTSLKSFRHNFVDAARNSRIPDEIVQALKGDTLPGTLARYGHGKTDLEILATEMQKLRFKGLDLTHLSPG